MFIKDKIIWFWISFAIVVGLVFLGISGDGNISAIMFTAVIFIWYSVETRKLRVNSQESNQISVNPGLTFRYKDEGDLGWSFIMSNHGKGVALNPKIIIQNTNLENLSFDLNGVTAIYQGDWVPVSWKFNGKHNDQSILNKFEKEPLHVKIEFYSHLDPKGKLFTEIEIGKPPNSKIIKSTWI